MDTGTAVYVEKGSFAVDGLIVDFDTSDWYNIGIQAGYTTGLARGHIQNCLISAPGGLGVYIVDDSVKVHNLTVDGVYEGFNGYDQTVSNCIVTSHANYGFRDVNAEYCIADGNKAYRSGSQGTGSVNEDPLYCDPAGGEYTLRVDSYGNAQNNGDGLVGAFPVACMYGTLVRSTTFPGASGVTTLAMRGDTKIPSTKTLTLDDDALIQASDTDEHPVEGYDASKVALIVDGGTLTATGSSGHPATLESGASSPDEGDWVGIVLEEDAKIYLSYAEVRHAVNGIQGALTATEDPSITNCVFESNEITDIEFGLLDQNENAYIENNVIAVGGGTGMVLTLADYTFVVIGGNTVTGNGASTRGMLIQGEGYVDNHGTVDINGNVLSGFSAGEGVKVTAVNNLDSYGNTIQNASTGVLFERTGSPDLTCQFGESAGSENILSGNSAGITTTGSYTKPTLRYNFIYSNSVGIQNKSGASPNIGDSYVNGNNNITSNSAYCIWNRDGSVTVSAQGNYFGNPGTCPAPGCAYGNVDTSGWLCTNPLGLYVPMIPVSHGPLKILGVFPSPVTQAKGMGIKLYADREREVTVGVFDVAGRLVRNLGTHRFTGGWEISWDGRDSRGIPVPSGMYFASARADRGLNDVAKFVVVK